MKHFVYSFLILVVLGCSPETDNPDVLNQNTSKTMSFSGRYNNQDNILDKHSISAVTFNEYKSEYIKKYGLIATYSVLGDLENFVKNTTENDYIKITLSNGVFTLEKSENFRFENFTSCYSVLLLKEILNKNPKSIMLTEGLEYVEENETYSIKEGEYAETMFAVELQNGEYVYYNLSHDPTKPQTNEFNNN